MTAEEKSTGSGWKLVKSGKGRGQLKALLADDGRLFFETKCLGDENAQAIAMLSASWDGGDVLLRYDGRVYLLSSWLEVEYPRLAEGFRKAKEMILAQQD